MASCSGVLLPHHFLLGWRGVCFPIPSKAILFISEKEGKILVSHICGHPCNGSEALCRFLLDVKRRIPNQPGFSPKGE